jgi:hypothetical protein
MTLLSSGIAENGAMANDPNLRLGCANSIRVPPFLCLIVLTEEINYFPMLMRKFLAFYQTRISRLIS